MRPFEPSSAPVEARPFRFSRNPMHLGVLLALLGLTCCTATSGRCCPAGFLWLLGARFVLPEAAHMKRRFGARCREYQRRVRRWL